jgi:hypothetical protein
MTETVRIDADLHTRFKQSCKRAGVVMKAAAERAILAEAERLDNATAEDAERRERIAKGNAAGRSR